MYGPGPAHWGAPWSSAAAECSLLEAVLWAVVYCEAGGKRVKAPIARGFRESVGAPVCIQTDTVVKRTGIIVYLRGA